jgi:hypothetical protein
MAGLNARSHVRMTGCCSKASVRFRFSQPLEIFLTVRRDSRFVRAGAHFETVTSIPERQVVYPMRNHDFVSDGFLAVTAAGFVVLCSGLLVIAFS